VQPVHRVAVIYRNPLLRDIALVILGRQRDMCVIGSFTPDELRADQLAALGPTDLIVDQEVVDGENPYVVDLAARVVTYDGPKRLIVLSVRNSKVRVLSRHEWDNPSEADLAGVLRAA